MARDAIKFVRAFGGAIMESTPHLYISALAFSPVKSIIYTQFSPKYSSLAQIVDGGELHWPNLQLTIRGYLFSSVTFSPDGKRIATGTFDNTICLWDAETRLQLGSPLTGHTNFVTSVAFSPDGKRIASGSDDNAICMWDAETGLQLGSPLTGHTDWVTSVAFSPDRKRIASGSRDKTICLWDAETGLQLGSPLTGHTHRVTSVAFSPDGKRIASGSNDRTICLWDAETQLQLGSPLTGHTHPVTSVAFSPDGKRIASGSHDKTVCLWDAETGLQLGSPLTGHTNFVTSVTFSPDGKRVVSGSDDNTIHMWDCPPDDVGSLFSYHIPRQALLPLCYSPNPSHALLDSNVYTHKTDFNTEHIRALVGLQSGGWITSPEGHLLLWVPSYMPRPSLYLPSMLFVLGKCTKLDLSKMVHGSQWVRCNYPQDVVGT